MTITQTLKLNELDRACNIALRHYLRVRTPESKYNYLGLIQEKINLTFDIFNPVVSPDEEYAELSMY